MGSVTRAPNLAGVSELWLKAEWDLVDPAALKARSEPRLVCWSSSSYMVTKAELLTMVEEVIHLFCEMGALLSDELAEMVLLVA